LNCYLLAAVDCTGHGIPGAFMSLIGTEKLTKIVSEEGLENPALILDSLDAKLNTLLKQDQQEAGTTDGMDLALVAIDKNFTKLTFSGAHRPLYLVRNQELIEYKGDPFGVGGFLRVNQDKKFSSVEIDLEPGDMIYIFSDGFVGQFDAKTGKKYLTKTFKELLKTVSIFDGDKQKLLIQHELRSFANGASQIDDILVIGFRIPDKK
jgi:serine phosphatase RsbU (regulator of sigma subunit)